MDSDLSSVRVTRPAIGGEFKETSTWAPVAGVFTFKDDAIGGKIVGFAMQTSVLHSVEGEPSLECVLRDIETLFRICGGISRSIDVRVNRHPGRLDERSGNRLEIWIESDQELE